MKINTRLLAAGLVALLFIGAIPIISSSSDADSSFTVKDSTGREFTYQSPSERVIAFGYAAPLTVALAGQADKLVGVDNNGVNSLTEYKYTVPETKYPSCTGANADALYTSILQEKEAGRLSFDDTIILTTYSANIQENGLRDKLTSAGFKYVMYFGTMDTYDDMISCIDAICKACGGTDEAAHMRYVKDFISTKLADNPRDKPDAIFIWYSVANGYGYGNTGSLSVAMMNDAGANNIGYNPESSQAAIYDKTKITQLLDNSENAIIFIDSGYYRTGGKTTDDFVTDILGGSQGEHRIIRMQQSWNNYDPLAAEGLWMMACALYPDLFSGDVPEEHGSNNQMENIPLYVGIAIGVVAVAGIALFLLRSKL